MSARFYNTPYQKIFTNKDELNSFLLKVLELYSIKKINLPFNLRGNSYINLVKKEDALNVLSELSDEYHEVKSLDSIKFQTETTGKFLLNFFNLRISIGFEVKDLTLMFQTMFSNNPKLIGGIPSEPTGSNNRRFIFCYLNLWPFQKTWRMAISKGNINSAPYNILAQDLISDFFQTSTSTFIPKIDHRIL